MKRPKAYGAWIHLDMASKVWIIGLVDLITVFPFATKGYEGKGIMEGVNYGAIARVLIGRSMSYGLCAVLPIPHSLALKWFLCGLVSARRTRSWLRSAAKRSAPRKAECRRCWRSRSASSNDREITSDRQDSKVMQLSCPAKIVSNAILIESRARRPDGNDCWPRALSAA